MANPPFNLKRLVRRESEKRFPLGGLPDAAGEQRQLCMDPPHSFPFESAQGGVAGFLLANGALGDSDTLEIRKKLIQNDKVEAIIILPRELFITTDISVTLWILNQNKKGGAYHGRMLRSRAGEILFMDLRTWTENPVKNESKKKVLLSSEQIQKPPTFITHGNPREPTAQIMLCRSFTAASGRTKSKSRAGVLSPASISSLSTMIWRSTMPLK